MWGTYWGGLMIFALTALSTFATGVVVAGEPECPDGRYEGAPRKDGGTYVKDRYTWAVTPEFARRFCMPEEFIDTELVGAEAVAYTHGKKTGPEMCSTQSGQESCAPSQTGHWLEIYVKHGVVPKYDPDVGFYVRDFFSSAHLLGTAPGDAVRAEGVRQHSARLAGEVLEPPGRRRPYFGIGPRADGDRIVFRYLARMSEARVEARAALFTEHYFMERLKPDIDQIALSTWSVGSIAGLRLEDPQLGYALGIQRERDSELTYPSGYLHTIYLPARITRLIAAMDRKGGGVFDRTVRQFMKAHGQSAN